MKSTLVLMLLALRLSIFSQETKTIKIPFSFYFGVNYSAMLDSNTYFGLHTGLQGIIHDKHFISAEAGLIDNTSIGVTGPYGENLVVNRTHLELAYAYKMASSRNGNFMILAQFGFQMQHILYHGKFLYTSNGGWVAPPTPVFETREYWHPAIPIRLKTLIRSRHLGFSVDLFANLSSDSDFGARFNFYIGKLKE